MNYKEEVINSQKNLKELAKSKNHVIVKAKFGPSKPTKILFYINEDLACFAAAIIGDGHLRKDKLQISLDCIDKNQLLNFKSLCKRTFDRDFNVSGYIEKGKYRFHLLMDSKAIYNLLNQVFEIPIGKKSHKVIVPKWIKNSEISIKSAFIIGLLATEGGRRKRGYGMSTASKNLWIDLEELFMDLGVVIKKDRWIHKQYNKEYYGLSFKKECLQEIIEKCKSKEIVSLINEHKGFY